MEMGIVTDGFNNGVVREETNRYLDYRIRTENRTGEAMI